MNFTHLLVGAAVASKISPVLGLPLAFASHFVIDTIPHNDGIYETAYHTKPTPTILYIQLLLDFALGIIILGKVTGASANQAYLALAALMGIMPDILSGVYYNFPRLRSLLDPWWKPLHDLHWSIQYTKVPVWVGISVNLLISLISIIVILL